jgi:hypothetical protein
MQTKRLHKHLLPIVVIAIAGLIASVGLANAAKNSASRQQVLSALFGKAINVRLTSPLSASLTVGSSGLPYDEFSVATQSFAIQTLQTPDYSTGF